MGSSSACLCIWPTEESIFHWTERRSSLTARPGRCSPSIPLQHHVGILKKKKIFVFDSRGDVHVTRVCEWVSECLWNTVDTAAANEYLWPVISLSTTQEETKDRGHRHHRSHGGREQYSTETSEEIWSTSGGCLSLEWKKKQTPGSEVDLVMTALTVYVWRRRWQRPTGPGLSPRTSHVQPLTFVLILKHKS